MVTRRGFLKGLAAGSLAAFGGISLEGCSDKKFQDDGTRVCGTNLVTWRNNGFFDINNVLENLIGLTNHVSLVTSYSMNSIYSRSIYKDENTPSLESLEYAIRQIRSVGGMGIMLKPHINVKSGHRPFIFPNDTFYRMYFQEFIYPLAEFAEKNSVGEFCIGTELMLAATINSGAFEKGIKGIRKRFSGKLTFAAYNSTASLIDFWDQLDFIGYNHYESIPIINPSKLEIENALSLTASNLESLSGKYSKKILFTEYGCTSLDGGSQMPSTDTRRSIRKKIIDLHEQDTYLKAFYNSYWEKNWCIGGDIWCVYNPSEIDDESRMTDYYWLGKPVESTITQRYSINAREGLRF